MKKYGVVLIVLMLALYVIHKLFFVFVLPDKDFVLLPLIPVFFILYGLTVLKFSYAKKELSVNLLLITKLSKTFLSLFFIMLYVIFEYPNKVSFAVSYALFFMIYLIYETLILTAINKKKTTL